MGRRRVLSPWPNVSKFTDRNGHDRWRWRKTGYPSVILHGEPGSDLFMRELAEARKAAPLVIGASKVAPGSVSAAIAAFYMSAHWQALGKVTQATYRGTLERFRAKTGGVPIAAMRRQDVLRMMDKMADRPSAANHMLQVVRILMRFALDRGMIEADPTHRVRKIRTDTGGFRDWAEDEIATFKAKYATGTRERLALALLLETAQRRGDVIRMGKQHRRGGKLHITQSKTGVALAIPITPELAAELEQAPKDHLTYLVTGQGASFTPAGFGNWFREVCDKAGLGWVSAHGLRKAAARRLAQDGCTAHEIAAITGHRSLQEVQRYTRAVDQEKLAEQAQAKGKARTDLSAHAISGFGNPEENKAKSNG